MFADVIVDISAGAVDRPFTYRVPSVLEQRVVPGSRVDIPFHGRQITGYVIALREETDVSPEKLKDLTGLSLRATTVDDRSMALALWMKDIYDCTLNQALKTVLPAKTAVKKGKTKVEAVPLSKERQAPPVLNPAQQEAVELILGELRDKNRPTLLFGVTGSGKTEVYSALIARQQALGKQCILLIPEIALTFQNLRRFYARFGDRVGVINSRQSAGEKYETVEKAKRGELDLVIGPRSALFTPFPNLGLILIDEEHEASYRSELTPRYAAVQVARQLMKLTGCGLVLGSATPSLESYYHCEKGEYRLVRLPRRAVAGSELPAVSVVDLRQELAEGNKSVFSRLLTEKIQDRLDKREQVMLFLNRRGYAGFVSCRSCGITLKCPHCSVSLTYHRDGSLRCHYCGYRIRFPEKCPACGSPYVAAFGLGTQKVETIVQKAFPGARVLRMDADTTAGKDGHSRILGSFSREEADILVGTQMIVKGHDFPNVTLVGVLAADLSLNAPDFRAGEETFQLLTQAVGRAGRSQKAGEAVIQTYAPDNFIITSAAAQDYETFYREELTARRMQHYPPFGRMLLLTVSTPSEEKTRELALKLKEKLAACPGMSEELVSGPADVGLSKLKDRYRQTLTLRASSGVFLAGLRHFARQELPEEELQAELL